MCLDRLQPLAERALVVGLTVGQDHEVQTSTRQKELVQAVGDLLTSKVPGVDRPLCVLGCRAAIRTPGAHVDALGRPPAWFPRLLLAQIADDGSFADLFVTDDNKFGFVERADLTGT